MGTVLYNEIDPYAAAWLSNLAAEGHVAPGRVDTRSIVDLRPSDLDGVTQFHAFAGIGGWSLALRLAGVPDDFSVWTGSCPCQPFSAAGQRKGFDDARHLWPVWFGLIRECRPAIVLGEQVEAAVRLGWVDAVFADLEGEGYACAAVVLGAHSVGAPHIRQRLWFVADASRERRDGQPARLRLASSAGRDAADRVETAGRSETDILADAGGQRHDGREDAGADRSYPDALPSGGEGLAGLREPEGGCAAIRMVDTDRLGVRSNGPGSAGGPSSRGSATTWQQRLRPDARAADGVGSPWTDPIWLPCRDGKARPTQPGLQPLAHGLPGRVGRVRAYGNAIVPQVAAEFIAAALGLPDRRAFA